MNRAELPAERTIFLDRKRMTVPALRALKGKRKIVSLTAYDYLMARLFDQAGVDFLLIGDSLGQHFQGLSSTLPVTLDEMIYHTRAVSRAAQWGMVISDMPFLSYQASTEQAVINCGRCLKEGGAQAVKLEGGIGIAPTVRKLVEVGIPVLGHIGLNPQSEHKLGGWNKIQARDREGAVQLIEDARALEAAGAFAVVIEAVPAEVAALVTHAIGIPTIGIGAGNECDGQILIWTDLLGLFEDFKPRFVRRYANLADTVREAIGRFTEDVREGRYPNQEESYHLEDPGILQDLGE